MKILYMASIYGLVTEIKRTIKKIYFYSGFYEETAAKEFKKKITAVFKVKTAVKGDVYSGF
jgi:hypothetical protein